MKVYGDYGKAHQIYCIKVVLFIKVVKKNFFQV